MEELVVYRALYDSKEFGKNALWARPKSMFLENVNVSDFLSTFSASLRTSLHFGFQNYSL
ncbi:MAG: hypothetical protein COT39_02550 [Parcubacteria group bacterium CG08_land_8_20_14_0_20_48_21]|nr:MAG: hypothetical protein COT39_02550 [Parcubacteria group bacterium CG08_land_8_20_14_0_20_48_21]PIW78999.1 MAG: hypothetical protein COZ99_03495 [Parcubacteria group bacterium CG_4_8_14_3_um_filter_48_16]PJC39457.1 MAG: hypothetical protein CO043_04185 [Parcubacteria group bacterium CG_4_9_14_0_2_um_filter_48_40]PJE53051.1 MAG: hypothetical protein COV80_00720 [Parcubacteria group bacterium CG11_big_fil_rev_8_21_14_0_20_48_46]